MKTKKKEPTAMEKITEAYEDFIKGKELNPKGNSQFKKTVIIAKLNTN